MKAFHSTRNAWRALAACAITAALSACGSSAPSQQLVDARRAYENAQQSPASRYTPDDLLTAREALDRAEAVHKDDPGSNREAHLAYIAARKAQIAIVNGSIAQSQRAEAEAKAAYQNQLERQAAQKPAESDTPGAKSVPEGELEPKPELDESGDPADPLLIPELEEREMPEE